MAASTKTGYDPSTMQWVEIDAAEARKDSIPGEDEYLQIMPAPSQPQHGLKSKQEGPPTPPKNGAKAQSKQNKPKPSNVPDGQKSKPPTFQAGDFPSLSSPHKQETQAAPPPPPKEPEAMHASACSDDEQETRSDVSGYTSVSKTVVATSNDIEARLSRLETKFEEQNKMILEQTKLTVEQIIPQQLNLSVQAAIQDLKQSVVPILTAR
ncbi:hypothetical protein MTO96_040983, partial [Rhipicephalus appendiculatus]